MTCSFIMCQESHYVGALENPNENAWLFSVIVSSKICILRKTSQKTPPESESCI